MPDTSREQYQEEAERLRLLDVQTQRDLIAMHRFIARNPKVSLAERRQARERARALERLLGLSRSTR